MFGHDCRLHSRYQQRCFYLYRSLGDFGFIGAHNYGFNQSETYHENKANLINSDIWNYIEGWLQEEY